KSLRSGGANMDVLVALGTSAAYFYSIYEGILSIGNPGYEPHLYFETSAILITLILFGKYLETSAKSRTTMALSKLLNLQAKQASDSRNCVEVMTPVEDVAVGVVMMVKPVEKKPVDGIVVKRRSSVDESMLTCEQIPIENDIGEGVVGSTIYKNGTIE